MVPYKAVCQLIRAGGELLNLPPRAICTALVFCHRFAHASSHSFDGLDSERVASTCLFTASKVEEASLRTNDLLNAIRHLHHQPAFAEGEGGEPGPAPGPGLVSGSGAAAQAGQIAKCPMLVGDAYYAAKAQLINDEQVLLRVLRFDIGVEQPHKYLYCFAKTLRAPDMVVRLATCIINDTLVYLDACITVEPEVVAASALHVASTLAQAPLPQPQRGSCWDALGLDHTAVVGAGGTLEAMLAGAMR